MYRTSFIFTMVSLIAFSGCGESMPPPASPDRARSAVQTVLETWVKGEKLETLQQSDPVIYVNDPQWSSGAKLIKYQIVSDNATGKSHRCEVLLTVKDGNSPPKEHQASYTVDTDPAVVVARD